MTRSLRTLLCLAALALLAACRIEDHTPAGSRSDESAIRAVVAGYISAINARDWSGARAAFLPGTTVDYAHATVTLDDFFKDLAESTDSSGRGRQLLRLDLRQVGDLAAGWGAYRLGAGSAVAMNHFVLRKTAVGWRIAHLSVARLQPGLDP
jgi:ketosteroid isomerase-like protein